MERTIKFVWDYYGEAAAKTAEHHKIHLQEFAEERQLKTQQAEFEIINNTHAIATLLLKEDEALELKDILRPEKAYVIHT